MRLVKSVFAASTLFFSTAFSAQADVNVVTSIKPVHSLVAAVMEGVGEPGLIVEGAGSPHTYALKPSQAQQLENADLIFWLGHELEAFLEKPLEAIAKDAKSVELLDAHDLIKLEFRAGGAFDAHEHGDEDDHTEHNEKTEKAHDHSDHKDDHSEHEHGAHEDEKAEEAHTHEEHEHGSFDPHVWLDPVNAKALVHEIEEALVEIDPDNATKYEMNAQALMKSLDTLVAEVSKEMEPFKNKGFVVFHDAYQNFENRFGLSAIGSVTISPEIMPGAERISELQTKVRELGATCVFSEPQFESRLVSTVVEGTQAKSGVLDPLGTSIEDGPALYFTLIHNMATSFKTCLSE